MLGCLTSSLTVPFSRSITDTSHCGVLLFPQVSARTEGPGSTGQLPTEADEVCVAHDPSEGGGHLLTGDKRSVPRRAPGDLAQRSGAIAATSVRSLRQPSLPLSAAVDGYYDQMSTPTASFVATHVRPTSDEVRHACPHCNDDKESAEGLARHLRVVTTGGGIPRCSRNQSNAGADLPVVTAAADIYATPVDSR